MTIKNLLTFHIAVPLFFGLPAIGAINGGVYAPAFLCALFAFVFTRFGWQLSCRWLQLPESFYRFRWWCVGAAFVVWAAALSANPTFQAQQAEQKAAELKRESERKASAEAAEAERLRKKAVKAEDEPFSRFFSAYDGSCLPVVRAVKANLRDPGSFEHIETGFYQTYTAAHVTMKYRAKNGFGGYTVSVAKAEVAKDGTVANLTID